MGEVRASADEGMAVQHAFHSFKRVAVEHPGGHEREWHWREPGPCGSGRGSVCQCARTDGNDGDAVLQPGGIRQTGGKHVWKPRPECALWARIRFRGLLDLQED